MTKNTVKENQECIVLGRLKERLSWYGSYIEALELEFLAQEFGAKQKQSMKKQIKYTDPPEDIDFASMRVVDPSTLNLPTPQEIATYLKSKSQKVTITLDAPSVAFFKKQAQKHGSKYQSMIREVLTRYAQSHSK